MPAVPGEFSEDTLSALLEALHERTATHPDNPGLIAAWPHVREERMSAACHLLAGRGHPGVPRLARSGPNVGLDASAGPCAAEPTSRCRSCDMARYDDLEAEQVLGHLGGLSQEALAKLAAYDATIATAPRSSTRSPR